MVFKLNKNKKIIWTYIYVYIFCLCAGHQAHAGSYVIGVEDIKYYPYFDFTSDKATLAKSLLDQFAKDSGHTISYLPLPIRQFPKWLYKENIDFKFPDNAKWQKQSNVQQLTIHFSEPAVAMTAGTIVLAKNQHKEEDFFKTIGSITGFTPIHWGKQIEQGKVSIYEDSSPKILVKYLANGLIDGLDVDLAVAKDGLQKLNLQQKLVISEHLPKQDFSYRLSTVKHPEIIKQFNQWLVTRQKYIETLKVEFGILTIEPNQANMVKK
ncbi:hypothetical protein [uncultured Paraglaciecola sp.]|uniref:hypothetical protein n=1 Tax=uncultured Paraglaciecola sp. TaxID=1765024 RepID=UPI0025DDB89C|nr:hypothetical protein [uncultured Paraglaciecola sp.]